MDRASDFNCDFAKTRYGCIMIGSLLLDTGPRMEDCTGTILQHKTSIPKSRAISSNWALLSSRTLSSGLKKRFPVAYSPRAGSYGVGKCSVRFKLRMGGERDGMGTYGNAELSSHILCQKLVRDARHEAGTVAVSRVGTGGTSVGHVAENTSSITHQIMSPVALDMAYKANA